MGLTQKAGLAIAELVFFAPAFLVSAFVVYKHGFKKQMGWFYLVMLSLLRIIGASTTIYSAANNDYSSGLVETSFITSAVGTAPLLLAMMGFQLRMNDGMEPRGFNPQYFKALQLISLAALILSIVAGTDLSNTDNASDVSTGRDCLRASSIIFLALYVALVAISLYCLSHLRWVRTDERILLRACVLACPFLLVRIVFTLAVAWSTSGPFYIWDENVWPEAFMMFAMEAIVVCIFAFAGLKTPRMTERELKTGGFEQHDPAKELAVEEGGQQAGVVRN